MKVTVIGAAGGIGQSLSLLLKLQLPKGSELRLYDISKVTPGVAADVSHIPTSVKVSGSSDNLPEMLKGADIVVVASTVGGLTAGATRSTLFDSNAGIIADLAENVAKYCPQACLGVITNPVNSLLRVAAGVLEKAGVYDKRKLFGITTLDVIRSEMFIAEKLGKAPEDISVNVVGGHSEETTVPLFSQVEGSSLPDAELQALTDHVKRAYAEVVEAKAGSGSATLSMAQAAARFVLSLSFALEGKKNVKECAYVEGDGTRARFFSQPLLLGTNGVEEYLPVGDVSPREAEDLKIAVKQLGEDIALGEKFLATYRK